MDLLIVIVYVYVAIWVGAVASARKRDGASWFFISLLTTPLLALIFLTALQEMRAICRCRLIRSDSAERL